MSGQYDDIPIINTVATGVTRTPLTNSGGGLGKLSKEMAAGGESLKKEILNRWATTEKVIANLEKLSIPSPRNNLPPQYEMPKLMPDDLSRSNTADYTERFVKFNAWLSYVSPHLAETKARLIEVQNAMKILEAKLRKELRGDKVAGKRSGMSAEEVQDAILLNPDYQDLLEQEQYFTQSKILLESICEELGSAMKIISRNIELIKLKSGGTNRENNLGYRQFDR